MNDLGIIALTVSPHIAFPDENRCDGQRGGESRELVIRFWDCYKQELMTMNGN